MELRNGKIGPNVFDRSVKKRIEHMETAYDCSVLEQMAVGSDHPADVPGRYTVRLRGCERSFRRGRCTGNLQSRSAPAARQRGADAAGSVRSDFGNGPQSKCSGIRRAYGGDLRSHPSCSHRDSGRPAQARDRDRSQVMEAGRGRDHDQMDRPGGDLAPFQRETGFFGRAFPGSHAGTHLRL